MSDARADGLLCGPRNRRLMALGLSHREHDRLPWNKRYDVAFGAFFNWLAPWRPNYRAFAADILVIGANPLLTALTLLRLAGTGRSLMVAPCLAPDDWGYDLLDAAVFRRAVDPIAGRRAATGPGAIPPGVGQDPLGTLDAWSSEVFSLLDDALRAEPDLIYLDDGWRYSLASGRAGGERMVRLVREAGKDEPDPVQALLHARLLSCLRRRARRGDFGERPDDARWDRCLFARRLVVTSALPGGFAPEDDSDGVERLGTARRRAETHGRVLERAIEDLMILRDLNGASA